MKKLLLKSFLLLLAVAISVQGLILLARGFEREYFDAHGYAWLEKGGLRPRVVILGTSTVLFGLSPNIIAENGGYKRGEIVNLASMGGTPMRSYNLWRSLSPSTFDSTRIVLHSLEPWALSEVYYKTDDYSMLQWSMWQRLYLLAERGDQFTPEARADAPSGQSAVDVLTTLLLHRIQPDTARHVPTDYGAVVLDRVPKNFQERTGNSWFSPIDVYPISDLNIERLRQLKTEVEKRGAEFILLLTPKRTSWTESYRNDCREIDSIVVARLNASLGPVKVIGSFTMLTPEQERMCLNDNVHLNRYGQEQFSIYLAHELMRIDSIPRSPLRPLYLY